MGVEVAGLGALLEWHRTSQRRLPWRRRPNLFSLVVAEILLQKTRADDVEPVWRDMLRKYPAPSNLAEASIAEIYQTVQHLGLGKQRAARLKAAATSIVGGADQIDGLGSYGRGIVDLALGSEVSTAPVDGNIARVMTRLLNLSFSRGEARKKREVSRAVENFAAPARPTLGIVYALIDLGALVCLPRCPRCAECPLQPDCASEFAHR